MNLIWNYLNKVAEDAGINECNAQDPSKCWKHGNRMDSDIAKSKNGLDGVQHVYSALMGGVNSEAERFETTANSFSKALDSLRLKGANYITADKKHIWAKKFKIDGVEMPGNDIIHGDELKGSRRVADIGIRFGTYLGRAKTGGSPVRSGSGSGNGAVHARQLDARGGIPVPPPVRKQSSVGRKGPPVPPGRSSAKITQTEFQFDEATGKIHKYLDTCAEDADVPSLVEHDRARHHGHFDQKMMSCKLRDEIKKEEDADRIGLEGKSKDEDIIGLFKDWLPDTKIRVVSRSEIEKELKDVGDGSVMFSVSNNSNRRWKNYVFGVEHHQDVQQGYVISRTPPAVAKACFERHFGIAIDDDCPFLAFSNALVQHSYNEHEISFGGWSNAWRKLDNPAMVISPDEKSNGKDSLCFILPINDAKCPTGYSSFAVTYITDENKTKKYNGGKPYMSFQTGYGVDPVKYADGRTVYYVNTQAMRQSLSTDPLFRQIAEKSPTGASSCVLTEKDFSGQQLGIVSNDGARCQLASDVNGWMDPTKKEVVVASDADIRETLLHELGWHATLDWAKKNHGALYLKLLQYAQEAPKDVVESVTYAYGKRLRASEMIEEIGAERFTRQSMDALNEASEKWWKKMEDGTHEISELHVRDKAPKELSREEVDAIAALPPQQAVERLADAILAGRRLGRASGSSRPAEVKDSVENKAMRYLNLVSTEDAWVDSGTGNMAWKYVKPKRKTPFDRLSKKRIHQIIGENVSLIKTIDEDLLPDVASKIYWLLAGRQNPDRLIDWLIDECNVSEARAYLILTDQVRKAKERMKVEDWMRRGIKYAVWRHKSGEKDPRDYHLRKWDGKSGIRNGCPNGLDGFVFRLDKPPVIDLKTKERGLPSQLIGCKCYITGVRD